MVKRLIPRKFERTRFVGEAVVRPLLDGAPISVHVLDLGQSGLAMYASQALAMGQSVEITFPVTQSAVQMGLDKRVGRVVRSRAHPDGNVVGVYFAQPLRADEMKVLETSWVRS
jgi:hypothetical protein